MTEQTFRLTHDQQRAFDGLVQSSSRIKVLIGAAGTGKTTSIFAYVQQHTATNVLFLAPTNKAVGIIRDTAKERLDSTNFKRCQFATIHSALRLGLSPKSTDAYLKNRKQSPSEDKLKRDDEGNLVHRLVIIDECSMIDDCVLFFIKNQLVNTKEIIFMGDCYQLPPVNNDGLSNTFNYLPKFELTQVVRQEGDLVKWLSECRQAVDSGTPFKPYSTPETEYLPKFRDCYDYVQSGLESDLDFRILAYTNTTVDMWNAVAKDIIFGSSEGYFVGEKVIFTAAYEEAQGEGKEKVFYNTSSEYTIIDIQEEGRLTLSDGSTISYQSVAEQQLDRKKRKAIASKIRHLEDYLLENYDSISRQETLTTQGQIKRLIGTLKSIGQDNNNAPIRPAYALTVHNSQGSTYDKGLVIGKNLDTNLIIPDRNRLWYVAASRFKYGFKYH
jgi:exodeoxyribonuclease V